MWTITEADLQQAKGRLQLRRTNIETRYAEETKALDGEFAAIETLERVAAEFSVKHGQQDASLASEPTEQSDPLGDEVGSAREEAPLAAVLPVEIERHESGEAGGGLDILKPGSRWRMYRSTRPSDAETMTGTSSATE